ncbi:hypothetical protein [Streptomyces racemochromogenes]|uniref:hypothetical protein n=1 Tax=Streptomyces racemochromogenes TaxID=67353 RepID=UPI0035F0A667
MRYLVESFALGALSRGRSVEQFLGGAGTAERPEVRWVEIRPVAEGFVVILHEVEDIGREDFCDLHGLPEVEREDGEQNFGHEIGVVDEGAGALYLAEQELGAHPARWCNQGVAGGDYLDYVRAGRPGATPR